MNQGKNRNQKAVKTKPKILLPTYYDHRLSGQRFHCSEHNHQFADRFCQISFVHLKQPCQIKRDVSNWSLYPSIPGNLFKNPLK